MFCSPIAKIIVLLFGLTMYENVPVKSSDFESFPSDVARVHTRNLCGVTLSPLIVEAHNPTTQPFPLAAYSTDIKST